MSSLVDVLAGHVDGLAQLPVEDLPEWLTGLGVPAGWHIARLEGDGAQPSRIAVCNRQSGGGGGYCCETTTVFGFTGTPPVDVVLNNAARTLQDLHAEGVTTRILMPLTKPGIAAVRSSGYFSTGGLPVWAPYSSYLAGSELAGPGRLIEHSVFVESYCRASLADDITQLATPSTTRSSPLSRCVVGTTRVPGDFGDPSGRSAGSRGSIRGRRLDW